VEVGASTVSIGLRAKTARAIAVVLAGPIESPRVVRRAELILSDPAIPATYQPYHEVLDLSWERATVAVGHTAKRIEEVATESLVRLVAELRAEGFDVRGIGIVGAGDRNLEAIGSTHIRAHAAEGVLFRQVLEVAAASNEIMSRSIDQKIVEETASAELQISIAKLKAHLRLMGRSAGSPWRADEKGAATAAWLALAIYGPKWR